MSNVPDVTTPLSLRTGNFHEILSDHSPSVSMTDIRCVDFGKIQCNTDDIIIAAKGIAETMSSSDGEWARRERLFKVVSTGNVALLKEMLTKRFDDDIICCRSYMFIGTPDGWTLFHKACSIQTLQPNQLILVLETLTSARPDGILLRDIQGMLPIHVASKFGNLALVDWLETKLSELGFSQLFGNRAPLSLSGLTPLGCWSEGRKSRRQYNHDSEIEWSRSHLQQGDASIFPVRNSSNELKFSISGLKFASHTAPGFGAQCNQDLTCVEDCRICNDLGENERVFAVCLCDGHGTGTRIADNVCDKLVGAVTDGNFSLLSDNCDIAMYMKQCFESIDDDMKKTDWAKAKSGSTCTFVVIDENKSKFVVSHVGDSAAMLISVAKNRNGVDWSYTCLTRDHRVGCNLCDLHQQSVSIWRGCDYSTNETEIERIRNAGGRIMTSGDYANYITTSVASDDDDDEDEVPELLIQCSRSFGDFNFKANNVVCSTPDVSVCELVKSDAIKLLVVCSDGIWDYGSMEHWASFIVSQLNKTDGDASKLCVSSSDLQNCCQSLTFHAVKDLKSDDNVSVIIVLLSE